jgi:hypothetical protein
MKFNYKMGGIMAGALAALYTVAIGLTWGLSKLIQWVESTYMLNGDALSLFGVVVIGMGGLLFMFVLAGIYHKEDT